ncbi:MAG: DUF4389 domain-containing protein [Nanoarchaeota archaeon]
MADKSKKKSKEEIEKSKERKEILMRLVVALVSGIVLLVWRYLILVLALVHWFIVLFTGKRNSDLAEFSEYFNTEAYRFIEYLTFMTNERPFPFTPLKRLRKFVK